MCVGAAKAEKGGNTGEGPATVKLVRALLRGEHAGDDGLGSGRDHLQQHFDLTSANVSFAT
jgi:hypothetical protein